MSVKEGAVLHEVNSPTASTLGNPKFGPSGEMTYRVTMASATGAFAVDVQASTGDGAADAAHSKHPGLKVTHVEPAPQARAA